MSLKVAILSYPNKKYHIICDLYSYVKTNIKNRRPNNNGKTTNINTQNNNISQMKQ